MDKRIEQKTGFKGQHHVMLPEGLATSAMRQKPLLRGLLAVGAGYFPQAAGHVRRRPGGTKQTILIYCVKGTGWCELGGKVHTVHAGDLLVLPCDTPHAYGAQAANPWTIHWIHAMGANWPEYLGELGVSPKAPVVRMGDDLQVTLLFNEVLKTLEHGFSFLNLLLASHALAHLMGLLIGHHRESNRETSDTLQKVAQGIIYMSEHLDQPLRMGALAALANISPAHFTALFKEQTGCSPRDYLHLLRIHQACRLLQRTTLSIKEIASKVGYQDPFHFSRQFRLFQGVSPTEYRGSKSA